MLVVFVRIRDGEFSIDNKIYDIRYSGFLFKC